ncbi:MAG: hypothetical protein KC636_17130 [Myxococcales bacterium]|nr:hypothetical protein [Myxococcales bacterium]
MPGSVVSLVASVGSVPVGSVVVASVVLELSLSVPAEPLSEPSSVLPLVAPAVVLPSVPESLSDDVAVVF